MQRHETKPPKVLIGRYTYGVQPENIHRLSDGARLEIGSFCSIAFGVSFILGGNHRTDWISTYPFGHIHQKQLGFEKFEGHPATNGDIIVGNDVWIGRGATLMSGVKVGDGAVIAANSHVVRDVADYEIVGGNPAIKIKMRFDSDTVSLLKKLAWWSLPEEKILEIRNTLCSRPNTNDIENLLRNLG